jgi:probable F420-dependent oxidoreductase
VATDHDLKIIAPMPRMSGTGETWVAELRRLEDLGFDTACVSHHVTRGWQLGPIAAMAYAAASTTRLRVLSLVAQNPLQHPALLAKEIATIDRLSGGRVELGIGAGWLADDYATLGLGFESGHARVAQLAEALAVIRGYFTDDTVDFAGDHYRIERLEALPRCVQQPSPPILVGASGPRMLALAGRTADIVGLQPRTTGGQIGRNAVADLSVAAIQAKIGAIRHAADRAERPVPRIQFSCLHVHVTNGDRLPRHRSSWSEAVEAELDSLAGSPAALVGTASECAEKVRDWSDRFGISYWHLGQDAETAARIVEHLR